MKKLMFIFLALLSLTGFSQTEVSSSDTLKHYTGNPVNVYTKDYMRMYNSAKRTIIKVYPYALYAADVIDEINNNSVSIEKRRKLNNFYKDSYQNLQEEFKYVFYELYTSEGVMLMKLVHRETGMTVYEIAEKYRGKRNAEVFSLMGKIWDQDIKIKYDPKGADKIAEHVIRDIQSGLIPFNDEVITLDKMEYKAEQAKDKERAKLQKEREKEKKKAARKAN